MGLKKPITSTLKPVSGMCWTQPAQQGVQYRPPYPIYMHLSFCVPEKPLLLREDSSKRGTAQDMECRSCWRYLSPGPWLSSAPSPPWPRRSAPGLPRAHVSSSAASPGRRAVFKKQFPAEEDFFPRSLSGELPGAGFSQETIVKAALPPTRKGCH